jgi:membrane protease subunit HflK
MPWNNQGGGGPWGGGGSGGGGPWGQRPGGSGGGGGGAMPPPNIEEMLRKSQEKMRRLLPGGFGTGRGVAIVVVILVALWALSGFYRVQADERGVQLLFGKWVGEPTPPGLHWWPPSPIGDVLRPKVTVINRVNIGFRDTGDLNRSSTRDMLRESLMLTGDQNIADVEFTVQWRIADAGKFLFNIKDPEDTVKVAAESAMREVVGQTKLDDLITTARERVQSRTRDLLQRILDDYGAGISVERVQLQRAEAPKEVIDAFNDVQRARQDKERLQNEAQAYENNIVPTARGEAASVIQQATAYKERVVKEAQGEAARFNDIYASYKDAPEVTRRRLYIETMRDVLAKANKVIIDEKGGGQGVVPYLPLNELNRSARPAGGQ